MSKSLVFEWLVSCMYFMLWLLFVVASIAVTGVIVGYTAEKSIQRAPNCINSACEVVCKEGGKFVRHQGCIK